MSILKELVEDIEKEIVHSFKPKDTLPTEIFESKNNSYHLKSEIRSKLLEIADKFIEYIGVDMFVYDIILTGSLANYNWSKFSDVDLHVLIDLDEFDKDDSSDSLSYHKIIKDFFDGKKNLWNSSHDIKIKGYEVELYVQDVDEPHLSTGVYSVLNDEWNVEPKKLESAFDLDERKIIEKSQYYMDMIDILKSKSDNGEDVTSSVDELKTKLKQFRQSGLENGGEYSYENLTFKLLRRNKYIEKLLQIKKDIQNRKLSLSEQ